MTSATAGTVVLPRFPTLVPRAQRLTGVTHSLDLQLMGDGKGSQMNPHESITCHSALSPRESPSLQPTAEHIHLWMGWHPV